MSDHEELFETFKCSRCGAPVKSKYKAPPGQSLVYFCTRCGVEAYKERVSRPDVDRVPFDPLK